MIPQSRLVVVPCELKQANEYVRRFHRHHPPMISHRFSMAVVDDEGDVRGVAIVGLPKSRMLMDGFTVEVNRLATDGCANACSSLYGASWRTAKAMGYRRIVTYILDSEPGTTLKAAGWDCYGEAGGGSWATEGRPQVYDRHPLGLKTRWQKVCGEPIAIRWPVPEPSAQAVLDFGQTG